MKLYEALKNQVARKEGSREDAFETRLKTMHASGLSPKTRRISVFVKNPRQHLAA